MKGVVLAQTLNISGKQITGPLAKNLNTIADVLNEALKFIIPFAGVVLFLVIIWGGYDFLLSGGNPEKIKRGKAKLTTGIVGFLIIVGAYLAVRLISYMFNLGAGLF